MPQTPSEVTRLLDRWTEGDKSALPKLMPLIVEDLRGIARKHLAQEKPAHTLQPTALVNEVFLRLMNRRQVSWESRAHFFGFAAQLMRRVLVDHARGKGAAKRGSHLPKASLDEALAMAETRDLDLLALDEALNDLARIDPQGSRVVEMRFFAGLTHEEIAQVLGVSPITARRQWNTAKLWLFRHLKSD